MKKIIILSCLLFYVLLIWTLLATFDYFHLLAEYGVSEMFGKLARENMEVRYLYFSILVCTVIYSALCYYIYEYAVRYEWEHDEERIKKERIENYTSKLNQLLIGYNVFIRAHAINDPIALKALQKFQCHVEELPQLVASDPGVAEAVLEMIEKITFKITKIYDAKEVADTIEECINQLATMKRKIMHL